MSKRTHRLPLWVVWVALGVIIGLGLGFAVGWWLWPVEYTNTAPDVLRRDYRDDYILMVATAYALDGGNLGQAQERLTRLDPEDPTASVVELAERLVGAGGSSEDIARLARLASALGAVTPTLAPYLEGGP